MCIHYLNLFICFSVVLNQTSPLPVCPGDSAFTCTVTAPPGKVLSLIWSNPNNDQDQFIYTLSDTTNTTGYVGGFTVKLIEVHNMSLVSIATLTADTSFDDGHKEILCCFGNTKENGKIELSGKFNQSI